MITGKEVERVLPFPLKVEVYGSQEDYLCATGASIGRMIDNHNKKYATKVEHCISHFNESGGMMDDGHIGYEIYVGREIVQEGIGPSFEEIIQEMDRDTIFYKSIVDAVKGCLKIWHDRIVELQNENKEKIELLNQEEYYEMLYAYYDILEESKTVLYLKKLADRYPNSDYAKMLRHAYRNGLYGWQPSKALARKNRRRKSDELDNF